ncbi:hypothetical protein Leryth_002913 [Lithospermum erythrorhizon]|uniref:Glutamine dumper 3 n=1 Tax=Lithospermum erythrorhizon TaxID=34254 RepID=A0AAV3PI85_LITER|nr:hypothetical protein Leryth_002913 [Lithospermum erythrorhizon]
MTTGASIQTIAASAPSVQRSPWHSPVPYLFGGLAAMLGLIAFALLILACSYWKLSGDHENGETERDLEAGEGGDGALKAAPPVYEEKFLVIMAGQEKPTFLATQISSRASSFGSNSSNTSFCSCSTESSEKTEKHEEKKEENSTSGDSTSQQQVA